MEKYYCHKCGKPVGKGEVLCKDCYKKSKNHSLFNMLGVLFGLTSLPLAIVYLAVFKDNKTEFYRRVSIGIFLPLVAAGIALVNLVLSLI